MPLIYAVAGAPATADGPSGNVPASLCQGDDAALGTPSAPLFAMAGCSSGNLLSEAGTQAYKTRLPVCCSEQTAYQTVRQLVYRSLPLCGTPRSTGYLTGRPADRFLYPFRKIVI